MEILIGIIVVIFLFIFLTGKAGVGIRSSLIREIRQQCMIGISAPSNYHPSISLSEAYNALKDYDTSNRFNPDKIEKYDKFDFWVNVNGIPCMVSVKKENFKRGIRLIVTRYSDYCAILESQGYNIPDYPTNLRNI